MASKKRILFVDDESKVLEGLRRALRIIRHQWEMTFVESGEKALALMAAEPFDVIISDMRMPGMNGADLLREVMKQYPQVVRIILSGHSDQETIFRALGPTHQYLSKPCSVETIKNTVEQACALQELLTDRRLKRLVARMESLPSLPAVYYEIIEELNSPDPSIQTVGQILSKDIGMSAKILQLINSAFFGLLHHISSPAQAVVYLGLETVKNLVLSLHIFSQFKPQILEDLSLRKVWDHSVTVAALAKQISKTQGSDKKIVDNSFIAGLLHDSGKLVLAANLPQKYKEVVNLVIHEGKDLCRMEQKILGASHAEVGAYLMGLWGLPNTVTEAITHHHHPGDSQDIRFNPLTAVHVANVIDVENSVPSDIDSYTKIDMSYLEELHLTEDLAIWRDLYKEVTSSREE